MSVILYVSRINFRNGGDVLEVQWELLLLHALILRLTQLIFQDQHILRHPVLQRIRRLGQNRSPLTLLLQEMVGKVVVHARLQYRLRRVLAQIRDRLVVRRPVLPFLTSSLTWSIGIG